MRTYEDTEAGERFKTVNRIFGWGKARAPIWFIGLEEAEEWEYPLSSKDKETLEKYEKCSDVWFYEETGQIKNDEGKKREYTKVYEIMSKLLVQIIDGDYNKWKEYYAPSYLLMASPVRRTSIP